MTPPALVCFSRFALVLTQGRKKRVTGLTFYHRERLMVFLLCEDACFTPGPCQVPQTRPGENPQTYTNGSGQFQKFPCNLAAVVNLQCTQAPVAKRLLRCESKLSIAKPTTDIDINTSVQ